ncbi:trans-4-hydroxy-L-proline dehydratase [Collinsella tanakaei]|uniref:trans-4-hydroxy-L-proline dehydratase n=1 Tax=Collinsella tanakaei TaxID=626935 RepID=UPI0025A35CFF|nr:trans-4-hydroxy-L-proline dehydratase [Collinsella tanakaei]MDM8299599.1 pyruvate formate lyase family protein [Collinsella tanakaei]
MADLTITRFDDIAAQQLEAIDAALAAVRSHGAPMRATSHATWADDRGMNERIKRLRHQSETTQPYLDMERALIETATYLRHEGSVSVPELRGMVLRDYFANKTISIEPGELIVGEKGRGPQAAPTFPELCCHTLADMHNMNDREQVNFRVTDDDLAAQAGIVIPYWRTRASREKIMRAQTSAWHDAFEAGIFTEFYEQRAGGHTCLGSERGVRAGFDEIRADIQAAIDALDYMADDHAVAKCDELHGMLIALDAVTILAERYAELAEHMASEESDAARAAELIQIAENCRTVARDRPRTFWQWIQRYWFIHLAITSETNPWDAYTPGRLDQHLIGYYRADVEAGELTRERALELLECLWVKFNNQPAPPKVGVTLKESGTYSDFANINTGGITPEGTDGVNEVSYLILDCMDEMMFIQPNSNVQISRKTPRRFLRRACEVARAGWGQPAFYNTEEIVDELLAAGKSLADARRGGSSGCVETGCWGYEAYPLTGYFNLPKILEITLNDGVDPRTGKLIGLRTGDPRSFATYDELFDAYVRQMNHFIDIKVRGSNINTQICARENPVPFMSLMTEDCIARGEDYNAGGARYNTTYLQGVGIGSITDALASIKYNVYDHARFTMDELLGALARNFAGDADAPIRVLASRRTPKYGNDDDYADDIMRAVFACFRDSVTGRPNMRRGEWRIDMLPTTCHIYFGEVTGASPSGRLAGEPVSDGISPEAHADVNGPTAVIKSCAKMDHASTGGTLLNQKFTPSSIAGDRGLDNLADLVRSYFDMGGHHVQFNIVDRETLIDAQRHPEAYRDLIVRVAGFSEKWCNLGRELQDEIINRTVQGF